MLTPTILIFLLCCLTTAFTDQRELTTRLIKHYTNAYKCDDSVLPQSGPFETMKNMSERMCMMLCKKSTKLKVKPFNCTLAKYNTTARVCNIYNHFISNDDIARLSVSENQNDCRFYVMLSKVQSRKTEGPMSCKGTPSGTDLRHLLTKKIWMNLKPEKRTEECQHTCLIIDECWSVRVEDGKCILYNTRDIVIDDDFTTTDPCYFYKVKRPEQANDLSKLEATNNDDQREPPNVIVVTIMALAISYVIIRLYEQF